MRGYLKRYGLTLLTLFLVVLGAAMPWVTSQIQDARISKLQEDLELNTVSLTLLENNGVKRALQIVLSDYMTVPWGGGTNMTQEQALQASLDMLAMMSGFGLMGNDELYFLNEMDGKAEPYLLVAEDGNSVLVWNCVWDTGGKTSAYNITVDDASGKVIQLWSGTADRAAASGSWQEDSYLYYPYFEDWFVFLAYYYDIQILDVQLREVFEEENVTNQYQFTLIFSDWNNTEQYEMRLTLYYGEVAFNY